MDGITITPTPLRRRLEVSVREDGTATVLRATGELDLAGSPRLAARLNDVIWRGTGDVVIELDVRTVDSTGLAVLLNALRRLDRHGRRLRIVSLQPTVRRTLELTRLSRELHVTDRVDDAITAQAA
jgi:anti-sigma B factor antagonist